VKKAQAAMEFLMTYGWAILVVLIAIGALWYFVGNPADIVGDNCRLATPFSCEDYKANDATSITLQIRNGLNDDVTLTSVELVDEGCTDATPTPAAVGAGSTAAVVIDGCTFTGTKVKSSIKITYDVSGGLTGKIVTGSLVLTIP